MNITNNGFPPTSRYAPIPTTTMVGGDGREITFLQRRVVPAPESLAQVREHIVIAGDRLDNVTSQQLGDPTQFWQIADANGAFEPAQLLTVAGARLRITLPKGVPAPSLT